MYFINRAAHKINELCILTLLLLYFGSLHTAKLKTKRKYSTVLILTFKVQKQ